MLIVYRYLIPFPLSGAHGIQIAHTCHALARAGAEVWLYVASFTEPTPEACLAYYGLKPHPNLKLRVPPQLTARSRRWRGSLIRLWEAWRFGRLSRRKPVFVLRDGEDNYPFALRLYERRSRWNCTVLMEVHRLHAIELEQYCLPDAQERDRALVGNSLKRRAALEQPCLAGADGLLPISKTLVDTAAARFGPLPPIEILPSGTPVPEEPIPPIASRKGIVYVGQLYAWKGTNTLIEAMQFLDDTLTIVGGDRETELAASIKLAADLGVAGRIQFIGQKQHAEARGFLSRGRCTVVALSTHVMSRLFTSPVKLFEAMAAGTPIVATDLPTTREVLRHESNALLVPGDDPRAMADAIRRVLDDDALATRLQKQALVDVRAYTFDARAERILRFARGIQGSRHLKG